MTKAQISAVSRKRAKAQGVGKPTNVKLCKRDVKKARRG